MNQECVYHIAGKLCMVKIMLIHNLETGGWVGTDGTQRQIYTLISTCGTH